MRTLNYWLIKKEIWKVLLFALLVASFGWTWTEKEKNEVRLSESRQSVTVLAEKLNKVSEEKQQAEIIARVAQASSKSPKLTEEQIRTLIAIVIPEKKAATKFFGMVKNCENGTLDPKRVNINKDGSIDLGVAQINEYWHSKRVQSMFGEDFTSAMSDTAKNIMYAGYLWQKSGNFSLWACDKKTDHEGQRIAKL